MTDREQIERAIQIQESLRSKLGDEIVDVTIRALKRELTKLTMPQADQRRQMTILFADLSGFTSMSEFIDAEQVKDLVHELWQRLDAIIVENGGVIDKHIGDAVMALWSKDITREDDPESAIRAALTMQSELGKFAEEQILRRSAYESEYKDEPHFVPRLHLRIGINTGYVLLGSIGSIGEVTPMGDTVNLASRLEHAAPVGGILISHSTYLQVRNVFDLRALKPIQLKGKAHPVKVYEVLQAKPRAFRFISPKVEGIETQMIGRKAELDRLKSVLEMVVSDGELQAVTVLADAGLGKSRLLFEFSKEVDPLHEKVLVFNGRASRGGMQSPYSLFRDILCFQFEIQDSDSSALAREKLVNGIRAFFGSEAEPLMCAHFIGHLIGFDFSESPHLQSILGDAGQIRTRAFHQVENLFRIVARRTPAVIYIEDAHWADDDSLDLIDYLTRACSSSRLFILCFARPSLMTRRPSWGEGQLCHMRLELQPLTKGESRQLVGHILRRAERLPHALKELIVSCTEGNPFYIEELIKLLIEQKVVLTTGTAWNVDANKFLKVQVPPTLRGVLQARLDELTAHEKKLLQLAAVIGRVFWKSALEQLGSIAPEPKDNTANISTSDLLNALRRKELIYRRETSTFDRTDEYIFKHALLRDACYDTVLKRERRAYHRQVAAWIIEQNPERADEYSGTIAEHFELSQEHAKAAEWYGRGGDQARQTYSPQIAISYYKRALKEFSYLSDSTPQRSTLETNLIRWYEGLGYSLMWQAQFVDATESFKKMLFAAESAGDKLKQAQAWNHLAYAQEELNDYRGMRESTKRAEQLARIASRTNSTHGELARALNLQGWAYRHLGDLVTAVAKAEESLDLGKDQNEGTPKQRAHSFQLLSSVHTLLGDFEKAYFYCEQALSIQKDLGDRRNVEILINTLGEIDRSRGDFVSAIAHYQESASIAHEIGDLACEIVYISNLGGAYVGLGRHSDAETALRNALSLAPEGHFIFSETYCFLAEALLNLERYTEAVNAARKALELGQECNSLEFIGSAWRVLGILASRISKGLEINGQTYNAEECLLKSIAAFAGTSGEVERARALRQLAVVLRDRGEKDRGDLMWQEALGVLSRFDLKADEESIHVRDNKTSPDKK